MGCFLGLAVAVMLVAVFDLISHFNGVSPNLMAVKPRVLYSEIIIHTKIVKENSELSMFK